MILEVPFGNSIYMKGVEAPDAKADGDQGSAVLFRVMTFRLGLIRYV